MYPLVYANCPKMYLVGDTEKTPGDRLREIRESLGLSARAAEKLTDPRVTHSNIGKIESGRTPWENVQLSTINGLARAYGMTQEQLLAEVSGKSSQGNESQGLKSRVQEKESSVIRIPAFDVGKLAAGLHGYEHQETPDRYMAFLPAEVPRGVPPEKLFMVQVGGDSMFEQGMPRAIPEGAWLMVERTSMAAPGQIVVAYIPDLDIAVVKQLQRDEANRNYLLQSYKVGGPTFWAQEHPDMRIQGVVRRLVHEL